MPMTKLLETRPPERDMHAGEGVVRANVPLAVELYVALNMVTDPILFVDAFELCIMDANVATCRFFQLPRQQLVGKELVELIPGLAAQRAALEDLRRGEVPASSVTVDSQPRDGQRRPLRIDVRWANGEESQVLIVMVRPGIGHGIGHSGCQGIAPVPCDALTGLPNRHWWMQQLRIALNDAEEHSRHCAVLFIDLNDFKPVNDRYGHRAGDTVLKVVAKRLLTCVRPEDVVSRYGGDEFVALLRDVSEESAIERISSRIDQALREPIGLGEASLTISGAIGASWSKRFEADPERLIDVADRAMYRAKPRRRHRSAVCRESASPPHLNSLADPQWAAGLDGVVLS